MDERKLSNLISGLTGTIAPEGSRPASSTDNAHDVGQDGKGKQEDRQEEEHFCTIVTSVQLRKIRIIARREGLPIKQVVNAAFEKAIQGYEKRHGSLDGIPKRDARDLF